VLFVVAFCLLLLFAGFWPSHFSVCFNYSPKEGAHNNIEKYLTRKKMKGPRIFLLWHVQFFFYTERDLLFMDEKSSGQEVLHFYGKSQKYAHILSTQKNKR